MKQAEGNEKGLLDMRKWAQSINQNEQQQHSLNKIPK